jgi:hypothetical protein
MDEAKLLARITYNPKIFGGKPIIRGRRLAVGSRAEIDRSAQVQAWVLHHLQLI